MQCLFVEGTLNEMKVERSSKKGGENAKKIIKKWEQKERRITLEKKWTKKYLLNIWKRERMIWAVIFFSKSERVFKHSFSFRSHHNQNVYVEKDSTSHLDLGSRFIINDLLVSPVLWMEETSVRTALECFWKQLSGKKDYKRNKN